MRESNFSRSNLVHMVGYSLEKVHTGILASLLEFQGKPTRFCQEMLALLFRGRLPTDKAIKGCKAYREYKFGRLRADLFLVVDLENGITHCCCIEAKVDSDIRIPQLVGLENGANGLKSVFPGAKWSFSVLALGASRFTLPEDGVPGWGMITPQDILKILEESPADGVHSHVLKDWAIALKDEVGLFDNTRFLEAGTTEAETRKQGHGRWYAVYEHFRLQFHEEGNVRKRFNIYSAGHNAVCNEDQCSKESWIPFECENRFFWEFNSGDLFLKANWVCEAGEFPQILDEVKGALTLELEKFEGMFQSIGGARCGNRKSKGGHFSLLKWPEFLREEEFHVPSYYELRAKNYLLVQAQVNRILREVIYALCRFPSSH